MAAFAHREPGGAVVDERSRPHFAPGTEPARVLALADGLLLRPIDRRSKRAEIALIGLPGFALAIAILVADRAPTASLLIYAGVPVAYFLSISVVRTHAPEGAAERVVT